MDVRVIARLRPAQRDDPSTWRKDLEVEGRVVRIRSSPSASCTFDDVFRDTASSEEVYDQAVRPFAQAAVEGFNVCLLVLGETSTGKVRRFARQVLILSFVFTVRLLLRFCVLELIFSVAC